MRPDQFKRYNVTWISAGGTNGEVNTSNWRFTQKLVRELVEENARDFDVTGVTLDGYYVDLTEDVLG